MKKQIYKIIFTISFFLFLTGGKANAQNDLDVIRENWLQFTDAPNSLYRYLSGQAYVLLDKRASEVAAINSLSDWQKRQQFIRTTLMDIVGPFPEKTPLNTKVLRIIKKEEYRIEHIVFESQPGFFVTCSMFIPAGLKAKQKAPAVIFCSGHAEEGYRYKGYMRPILNLVKKGFIILAFDPVGQGERLQYFDPKTGKSTVGGPTVEHSYPGTQAFIIGSSMARYMIWDGIRVVDYLLTRKEVDPARIGITGRSGGGTQTAIIAAMDDRIYASAPECYITNFTRLLQTRGPQDAEQNLFNGIFRGLDHADLLSVRAPKPVMMITTSRDIFNAQGAMETGKEVARIFKAYGKEDNFSRVEDDTVHASTKKNSEAMYAFFQKQLNNPGSPAAEEINYLSPEELQVTATGQISTSLGGETVFSLNLKEADKLNSKLQIARSDLNKHLPEALISAIKLSGYQEPDTVNEPVFSGRYQRNGYVIEKYFVKGEGDYIIPYLLMIPVKSNGKALIYLHPVDKSSQAATGGEIEWFVKNGFTVLSPDLIGVGEMGPNSLKGDSYIEGFSHNLWYASMLIGRSVLGIRAADVVMLSRLLKKNSSITEIYGLARKEMATVMLHAAAFNPQITRIALIEPYSSYQSIVMNRTYYQGFVLNLVPGALTAYDLPDLAACLAPRKLMMSGVTDGNGNNSDLETINKDLLIINNAYQSKNAPEQLRIISPAGTVKMEDFYKNWIN